MKNESFFDYLPDVFASIKELVYIYASIREELVLLIEYRKKLYNNLFISTADEEGVNRWEKSLKLNLSNLQTEEKRFEITIRLNEGRPYTFKALKAKLEKLCGKEGFELIRNVSDKTLTAKLALTEKGNVLSVSDMLERLVPANMIIEVSLKYNKWTDLSGLTWGGASSNTWDHYRNEVLN